MRVGTSCERREKPRRLAHQHVFVRLSILLVHDDINNWVDAGAEIKHQVAEDVHAWMVDVLVGDLDDCDGEVTSDERQENRQHHLRDAPLIAFLLSVCFIHRR